MSVILGLNAYHVGAVAAISIDGQPVAAIDCFLRAKMDVPVIGPFFCARKGCR